MNAFRALLRAVGAREAARRLGVSERTIRRWATEGPSREGRAKVKAVVARRTASLKAARTRERLAQERAAATKADKARRTRRERDQFQRDLADQQGTSPEFAPRTPPAVSRRRVPEVEIPGSRPIDTYKYTGSVTTIHVGKGLESDEFVDSAYAEMCVQVWKRAKPFRHFCRVIFLFFRFVAGRGLAAGQYRGELVKREGRWFDWWASTAALSTEKSIGDGVEAVLYKARNDTRGNQIVWLEQMQVQSFEWREDAETPSIKDILGRPLK